MDKRQAEFRNYFLEELDERQTYFATAGDLFAGNDSRSVVRLFAEMMASFFPNMDVAATAGVARELCLSVRGSLIGPVPASVGSGTAEKTRKTILAAFWILVLITLVISIDSPRVAATISALVAAVALVVAVFTKKASREPDVDPRLAAFEVLLATNFIHVGLWMAIVGVCIWAIVLAKNGQPMSSQSCVERLDATRFFDKTLFGKDEYEVSRDGRRTNDPAPYFATRENDTAV